MSKYTVNITMTVTEVGAKEAMSVTNQDYRNMDYEDLVAVEHAVCNSLLDLGKAASTAPKK